jgi:UPF0716 protein FxsA
MAVLILLYVIVEVLAVWAVASVVGALWTIALLLAGAVVGSWLARREGGRVARSFLASSQAGRSPHNEVTDGMLVAVGGLLILLPGFVSDLAGLLVLLPPTRGVLRRAWLRRLERMRPAGMRGPIRRGSVVVDGTVVDGTVVDGTVVAERGTRPRSGDDDRGQDPPRVIESN